MNFDLFVRFKKEDRNAKKWDKDFIVREMKKFDSSEIQRIWVCGPPKMNEMFDRVLTSLDDEGMRLEPH